MDSRALRRALQARQGAARARRRGRVRPARGAGRRVMARRATRAGASGASDRAAVRGATAAVESGLCGGRAGQRRAGGAGDVALSASRRRACAAGPRGRATPEGGRHRVRPEARRPRDCGPGRRVVPRRAGARRAPRRRGLRPVPDGRYACPAASLVVVTPRTQNDRLFRALRARPQALREAGIERFDRIGDCDAPGLIAHAVFAGHLLARRFDAPEGRDPTAGGDTSRPARLLL